MENMIWISTYLCVSTSEQEVTLKSIKTWKRTDTLLAQVTTFLGGCWCW
jgi:hypothetical protein